MKSAFRLLAAVPFLASAAAFATPSTVAVSHCWIRAMPASIPSGGFFDVVNSSAKPVDLTGVETSAFGMAMLHRTQNDGGVSKMMMVDKVAVPANGTLSFAPGGYHVMLENAKQPLKIGATLPLTFTFGNGETVTAQCKIDSPKTMSK